MGHDGSSGADGEDHLGGPGPGQCGTSRRSTIPVCPGLEGFLGVGLAWANWGRHSPKPGSRTYTEKCEGGGCLGQMVAGLLSQPSEPVLGTHDTSLPMLSIPTACSTTVMRRCSLLGVSGCVSALCQVGLSSS